jgi:hypothetical protein
MIWCIPSFPGFPATESRNRKTLHGHGNRSEFFLVLGMVKDARQFRGTGQIESFMDGIMERG